MSIFAMTPVKSPLRLEITYIWSLMILHSNTAKFGNKGKV